MMLRRAIVLAGLILGVTAPADAQIIRGRLLDDSTSIAVSLARINLVQANGGVAQTVVTDTAGRFTVTVPAPGGYQLRAERIGYTPSKSPMVFVGENDTLHVVLRVGITAITLPALEVTAASAGWNRSAARDIADFRDRVRRGMGRFLLPDQIRRLNAFRASDLLTEFQGVRVTRRGSHVSVIMGGPFGPCAPAVFVDGHYAVDTDLDEAVSGSAVRALEVYRRSEVPGRYIVPGRSCGAIVVWTHFKFGDFAKQEGR